MKVEGRMYHEARKTLNPFVGCGFNCSYCYPSFRRQAKRQRNRCKLCYDFTPHPHLERLEKSPPRTKAGEFVFLMDMGDPSFAPLGIMHRILRFCAKHPETNFLLQSKDPWYFVNFDYPPNVILATTIETNESFICEEISKAPPPTARYEAMRVLREKENGIGSVPQIVTIEPILMFDLPTLSKWIKNLHPWRVYIGYDSHPKENQLPEPTLADADALVAELRSVGIDIRWKLRRRAWWENHQPMRGAARGAG